MARSDERAAENELVFRRANEEIDERRRELGIDARTPYLCECEEERCTTIVRLSVDEYGRARAASRRFIIAAGHSFRDGDVVMDGDGFVVVEKKGVGGAIAAAETEGDVR